MGFRTSPQARIFVDENIPSFLKTTPENRLKAHSQPATSGASAAENAALVPPQALLQPAGFRNFKPASTQTTSHLAQDRRRQPMHMRPQFMFKAVGLAIVLNVALYSMFQSTLLYRQSVPTQQHSIISNAPTKDDTQQSSIVSYRYAATSGAHETP